LIVFYSFFDTRGEFALCKQKKIGKNSEQSDLLYYINLFIYVIL